MIKGILLSAGESTRMGKLKPLLTIGDRTVIETLLEEYLSSSLSEVVLVLGYRANDIKKVIKKNDKLRLVVNKDYKKEMFSSIQTGLKNIKDAEAVLIGLADCLLIDRNIINKMIRNYQNGHILIPTFKGRKGHPIIIPFSLKDEILAASPEETTLRDILRRHTDMYQFVEMNDNKILFDMDTKEDYERAKALWKK